VTPPERQILGYVLQMGDVPACVAAVPLGAWSGPMALCLQVLNDWQSQGLAWQPTDLWEWVRGDARLSRLVDAHEVLCAPMAAPWDLEGVEACCEVVTKAHRRIEGALRAAAAREVWEWRWRAEVASGLSLQH
jgi:hypothetical protein